LLRTLIKVWAERKQQKPGSKFKTKLVVSLILLTLIPATCLFLFAFGLVNRSIVKWFSVPVDQIFEATADLSGEWRDEHESIARSILDLGQEPREDLGRLRQTFQLKVFMVLDEDGHLLRPSVEPAVPRRRLPDKIIRPLGDVAEASSKFAPTGLAFGGSKAPKGTTFSLP